MLKTKRTTLAAALCLLPLTSFADLDAKLAGALICSDSLPIDYSVMACNMGGQSTLNFYAQGSKLVSIDRDSLVLTKLDIGNESMLNLASGKPNYEMGSFPDIEENGTLAEWDILLKSGLTTLAGKVSVKGSVTAYTGSGSVTEESPLFDFNDHKEMQVGPVRIKPTKKVETSDEDIIEKLEAEGLHSDEHIALFKEMLDKELVSKDKSLPEMDRGLRAAYPDIDESTQKAIGPMIMAFMGDDLFSLSNDDTQVSLRLDVDDKAVESMELKSESGEVLSSEGKLTSNGIASYLFEKPESGKVQLVVTYQKDLKPVKINIDI